MSVSSSTMGWLLCAFNLFWIDDGLILGASLKFRDRTYFQNTSQMSFFQKQRELWGVLDESTYWKWIQYGDESPHQLWETIERELWSAQSLLSQRRRKYFRNTSQMSFFAIERRELHFWRIHICKLPSMWCWSPTSTFREIGEVVIVGPVFVKIAMSEVC